MTIKHKFVSAIAEGADAGAVRVSNWNDDHTILDFSKFVCNGRLTLQAGEPVSTIDRADKTNLYFTPYKGNEVSLYDGTNWIRHEFTERTLALGGVTLPTEAFTNDPAAGTDISLSVASTTGFTVGQPIVVTSSAGSDTTNISALVANTSITAHSLALNHTTTTPLITGGIPVDIYLYNNAGALTLSGTVWTNGTTRATALVAQDGVYCKTGALTYRYLGTIYMDADQECQDTVLRRYVWNYYNRNLMKLYMLEASLHTYNVSAYRAWNNDAALASVYFVIGVLEEAIQFSLAAQFKAGGAGINNAVALGKDGADPSAANGYLGLTNRAADQIRLGSVAEYGFGVGYHSATVNEYSTATAGTFYDTVLQAFING